MLSPTVPTDLEWDAWIARLGLRSKQGPSLLRAWWTQGSALLRARFGRWMRAPLPSPSDLEAHLERALQAEVTLSPWMGKAYGHEDRAGVASLLFTDARWLPVGLRTAETWLEAYAVGTGVGVVLGLLLGPGSMVWSVERIRRTMGIPWSMAWTAFRLMWRWMDLRRRLLVIAVAVGYMGLLFLSVWQQVQTCLHYWHVGRHVEECVGACTRLEGALETIWRQHPSLAWMRPAWTERAADRPLWNWGRALSEYDALRRHPERRAAWQEALASLELFVRLRACIEVDQGAGRPWTPVQWTRTPQLAATAMHLSVLSPDVCGMDWEEATSAQVFPITGPNGSGKTMCLLALGWTLLWSRTLGWVPARTARVPRWTYLATSIRHSTEVGRASLFQAELDGHREMLSHAQAGSWILLDEPFHSTDRDGSVECGAWLLGEYVRKGARVVLTTHERAYTVGPGTSPRCTARPPFSMCAGVWHGSVAWEELARRFPTAAGTEPSPPRDEKSTSI